MEPHSLRLVPRLLWDTIQQHIGPAEVEVVSPVLPPPPPPRRRRRAATLTGIRARFCMQVKRVIGTELIDGNATLFDEAAAYGAILGDVQVGNEALLARQRLRASPQRKLVSCAGLGG
jgi:hypothetical protein